MRRVVLAAIAVTMLCALAMPSLAGAAGTKINVLLNEPTSLDVSTRSLALQLGGVELSCSPRPYSVVFRGVAKRGEDLSAEGFASLSSVTSGGEATTCEGPSGSKFTLAMHKTAYLDASEVGLESGRSTIAVTEAELELHNSECTAIVAGEIVGAPFSNSTHDLVWSRQSGLMVTSVKESGSHGCVGVKTGSATDLTGTLEVSGKMTITPRPAMTVSSSNGSETLQLHATSLVLEGAEGPGPLEVKCGAVTATGATKSASDIVEGAFGSLSTVTDTGGEHGCEGPLGIHVGLELVKAAGVSAGEVGVRSGQSAVNVTSVELKLHGPECTATLAGEITGGTFSVFTDDLVLHKQPGLTVKSINEESGLLGCAYIDKGEAVSVTGTFYAESPEKLKIIPAPAVTVTPNNGTEVLEFRPTTITFEDENNMALDVTCAETALTGKIKMGEYLSEEGLGSLSSLTASSCEGPLGVKLSPKLLKAVVLNTWEVEPVEGNVTFDLADVEIELKSSECTMEVSGEISGGVFNDSEERLRLKKQPGLKVASISSETGLLGCGGIRVGNTIDTSGTVVVENPRSFAVN